MTKIIALLALACLVAFTGIVLAFVSEPDLIIITVVVLMMAAYDFYLQIFRAPKGD